MSDVDALFAGDAQYGPQRDRWGRSLLTPAGSTEREPYTRASSLSSYVGSFSALDRWKQRRLAYGLAQRPDLAAMAAALPRFQNDSRADRATNQALDEIIQQALESGQATEQANWGTAVHSWTEPGADLFTVHDPYRADVAAYHALIERCDIEVLDTEVFVANDALRAAGTVDHLMRVPGYGLVIADKKTGSLKPFDFGVQLAVYAYGERYDWETDERTPWPDDLNLDVALVVDIPRGKGEAHIHEVDLRWALECAQVAADVRDRHSAASGRLTKNVEDDIVSIRQTQSAVARSGEAEVISGMIRDAGSREELLAIREANIRHWSQRHTDLARERVQALQDSPA